MYIMTDNLALIELALVLFTIILPIVSLIDIVRNTFSGNNKLIWVLVVLFIPLIGYLMYFIIGTKQKIK